MRRDVLTATVCLLVTSICPAQPGATGGESSSPSIGSNPVHNSSLLAGDVGVDSIICPRGTVDSGQTVVPRLIVANYGSNPESLVVKMAIDQSGVEQYSDSLTIGSLQPGAYDTIEFGRWIPDGRDSMTVTAWTECAGDTFPANDTLRARFLVRVLSVKITALIWPPMDTLDSGAVVYPRVRVWNYGNQSKTFDVRFRILPDSSYYSVRSISLIPGGATLVTLPDSWVTRPGMWVALCSLVIPPDTVLDVKMDTFWVRGTSRHEVGVLRILAPVDTIDSGSVVTPAALVGNSGTNPETFWTWFSIWDSTCTAIYRESTQVLIGPSDSLVVMFTPDIVLDVCGQFVAACSVYIILPDTIRAVRDTFWVVARPGVEESHKPQAASSRLMATAVRGVLFLPEAASLKPQASSLLDAAGRKVMDLWPGANDVRHLAGGIYFVRQAQAQAQAQAVHKVVVMQ